MPGHSGKKMKNPMAKKKNKKAKKAKKAKGMMY